MLAMESQIDRVRAAIAVLPSAVVSHSSAAFFHGIGSAPKLPPTVTVHSSTTHQFPGVLVVRCRDLVEAHITRRSGVPVTTPARTIVDLAARLPIVHVESILDDAVAARLTTVALVSDVLSAVARRGKPGVATMRAVLEDRTAGEHPRSVLEARTHRLLSGAGIRNYVTEFPIPWSPRQRFDIAFIDEMVAVELDSRRWHQQSNAFQSDRNRDRDAVVNGWRLLRFTWSDVHERPHHVLRTIRTVVASAV